MYRMPENNQEVKQFWTALEVVFFSMQITYPITYFPSNWNILTLFTTFQFVSFHFILFCASWVLSYEFMLSKVKKLRGNVVFTTTAICIYFASLTLICKLLFIRWILLETKMSILYSQMFALLGNPFYSGYHDSKVMWNQLYLHLYVRITFAMKLEKLLTNHSFVSTNVTPRHYMKHWRPQKWNLENC